MEVQHVEAIGAPPHLVQHGHVRGEVGLQQRGIQADGLVADGDQLGAGFSLGAGEQRHLVAEVDEGVAKMGYDPLRAAVQLRRNRFIER